MCPDLTAELALQHCQRRTRQHHTEPDDAIIDASIALVASNLSFWRQHEYLCEGETTDTSADDDDL
jgi:hypothetical protein